LKKEGKAIEASSQTLIRLGLCRENVGIPYNPTLHIFYKMYYTWVYLCQKNIPVGEKTFGAPTPSCGFLRNTLLLPGD
jgi:hypothetical protein